MAMIRLETIWKEAIVPKFWGSIPTFACSVSENSRKISVNVAGLRAEIWTRDLTNTKQEC
jgi:hypothetical protein